MPLKVLGAVVGGLITAALLLVVVWAIWYIPPRLMLWPYFGVSPAPGGLTLNDLLKAESDLRHSVVETAQVVATAVTAFGIVLTLYFTARNVNLAERSSERSLEAMRQSRLGERFSKALEQLGDDSRSYSYRGGLRHCQDCSRIRRRLLDRGPAALRLLTQPSDQSASRSRRSLRPRISKR